MTRAHHLARHWWFALALLLAVLGRVAGACGDSQESGGATDQGDDGSDDGQGTNQDAASGSPADAAAIDAAQTAVDAAVGLTVQSIGMGNNVSCAVLSNGSVRCWGANEQGQVGAGAIDQQRATPTDVIGLTDAVSVDCGTAHCCARTEGGGAQCWGWNAAGELGANMASDQLANRSTAGPVLELPSGGVVAELGGASQIAAGGAHNCALKGSDVWCWGWNFNGQSGLDRAEGTVVVAKPTGITDIVELALAHAYIAEHSCAITTTGGIVCWGLNDQGQLGDGLMETRHTAAPVVGLVQATALAAGQKHTCAIARPADAPENGSAVYCWGKNTSGQSGPAAASSQTTPVEVPGVIGAIALAAGQSHTCALLNTGGVKCWGANNVGQLGDGTAAPDPHPVPTDVMSPDGGDLLTGVAQIAAGVANTCARTVSRQVYCWGANNLGQLGQGMTGADALLPVAVPIIPER